MKAKNSFVQFKNENLRNEKQRQSVQDPIIAQKMQNVMRQKFEALFDMYKGDAYENGYNAMLAFRVIWLYLYCEIKHEGFSLIEEVERYLNHELVQQNIENIQKCMDLILTKKLCQQVPDKTYNLWKIRVLRSLKRYYAINHIKKQKKKISIIMRTLCKQQLQKQTVKHDSNIYEQILDIFLQEQRIIMNSKKAHNKLFQAIQNGNNMVRMLQKSQKSIVPKYQQQLMLAYWQIAKIHNQLHYLTYAKKYAQTALNIAERINDNRIAFSARKFLQELIIAT